MNLLIIFIATLLISITSTVVVKYYAQKWKVFDAPDKPRKIHKNKVPLLGGIAIFISFFLVIYFAREEILARGLVSAHLIGFFIGALIIIIGGILDDKYNLKPGWQIIFPVLAGIAAIAGGISIVKATNPFSSNLLFFSGGISAMLTLAWLMGMMYTTKLLDGIDGLVGGLGAISGMIIFLFTMTTKYFQPDVGLLGLIFAAACLGFLIFNFYPAKIFLGEGGGLLIGYIIAILAIISGGKIAIALLIMGIPIMDVIWTILRRVASGNNPFSTADKKHLHHRFLDIGLSQRQTVLIYYFLAAIFGAAALFLQSRGKVIALGILAIIMAVIIFISVFIPDKYEKR